ncbi:MAG: hypothetical protein J7521_22350 [Caulobacter sp.]|nr:hypothetical protein [Caulobacter sp.]
MARTLLLALLMAGALGDAAWARASPTSTGEPAMYVYRGAGCDGVKGLAQFESFLGRKVDGATDFFDARSWSAMEASSWWIAKCWADNGRRISLGVPLLPTDGSGTLREGAQGAYDAHFRTLAKALVSSGAKNAILRIGWEFNGGWFPWKAAGNEADYAEYFRRVVNVFRTYPGSCFSISWNITVGAKDADLAAAYPGDDYVDTIGGDFYNEIWTDIDKDPVKRWSYMLTRPYGLNWMRDFAAQHDKPLSFPEWGTGTRPDGHGGGDDPYFVGQMATWMKQNNVAYAGYWDYPASDYNALLSTNLRPNAAKAFQEAFSDAQPTAVNLTAKCAQS